MITIIDQNGEYEEVGGEEDPSIINSVRDATLQLPNPEYIWGIQQARLKPQFKNASLTRQQQHSCTFCGDQQHNVLHCQELIQDLHR